MSISTEFDRAYRLHQQGKLREAFLRYNAVLAADPDNAPALHYSGVVLYQAGKIPEAAERIRASLKLEPASSEAWSNLALVLESAGPAGGGGQRAARRRRSSRRVRRRSSPTSPPPKSRSATSRDAEASARNAIARRCAACGGLA